MFTTILFLAGLLGLLHFLTWSFVMDMVDNHFFRNWYRWTIFFPGAPIFMGLLALIGAALWVLFVMFWGLKKTFQKG